MISEDSLITMVLHARSPMTGTTITLPVKTVLLSPPPWQH